MFEAHVLHLLRRYLGEYVHGLSAEALRISVWKGDVVLKDLKLKAEALNSLNLPVTVKAGFIGVITLKVPWKSLGKEPVIVLIDRVFVLAQPASDGRTLSEEDKEKVFEAKIRQIEEAESATLEALSRSKLGNPASGNSWLGSLIATIIGNLKISISNVHIRYEDCTSNPGHPFSSGITLAKLAAVTMDEQGNETFDASGALDKLRKSLHLERLAMYHNSDSLPWRTDKKWEDLTPNEWIEIFGDGINESPAGNEMQPKWAMNRNYVVSPINGLLQYHRLGKQERNDPEIPFEKASIVLSDVSITLTEAQYYDWIKLLEVVSRYRTYVEVSHLRPVIPISDGAYLWWRYGAFASLQLRKMCFRISWDRVRHVCQLRRRYIQLYASLLQQSADVDDSEIREIERDLDLKVILLWRLLAHAKVESVKSKEAAEQRRLQKRSWFSFKWHSDSEEATAEDASQRSGVHDEQLTKEEWQAINKLLSYQPDEELASHLGKDMQNAIQFLVTISIGLAAARIVDINQTEIVCGRFEQLHVSAKFKHRSTHCDLMLKYYGLSAPEGSLAESVCSEQKVNALTASFVQSPVGENVDWKLSAIISPCHVTVLMESCDRFFEFMKRSNAISPTVALETATALQMKIEKVTRRAQEQFQMVLEEQSRFALDIDLDAPKVSVPIRKNGSAKCDGHFLLDFGHFTLHTVDIQPDEQRQNLYSRFYISGRDIAAFFTDCGSDSHGCTLVNPTTSNQALVCRGAGKADNLYSLVDRCGMAVIVDQIRVPHPSYPSTRVSVQVPNVTIHFSPARYCRVMELLSILYGKEESSDQVDVSSNQVGVASRSPADLATEARILVWRGIGNSIATWQSCFIVLSGFYLYVFESENSQTYQRYLSMAGRQVHEVPPENIGGSPFCIAVSSRGTDAQKALEHSSTWVIEFRGEEDKSIWLRCLVQATYQASGIPSVDVLKETTDGLTNINTSQTESRTADLVLHGAVVETKLCVYGKAADEADKGASEKLILEVLASGGKVRVIILRSDLTVKTKLHSLKIKDVLQGCQSGKTQYLVCSVLKNDDALGSLGSYDIHEKETPVLQPDEDDNFTDALPEFISLTDPVSHLQHMDDAAVFDSAESLIHEDLTQGNGLSGETFYEVEGGETLDFVSVTLLKTSSGSALYDGTDTQMCIRMSKLEFFFNRPTLVALIGFGIDLGSAASVASDDKSLTREGKTEGSGRIEGLLGFDKDRVVFYLNMNFDSVAVFLNKEDGSQLAMFIQESFHLDLKVHPSSVSIEGALGNFRLQDMSLGTDCGWGWLCDIRDAGAESLIKFKFNSYNRGDDDYEGYDYSLFGRLSAVRVVFLNRFIQEIMVYFMELATPHTEDVIKLVDKVGDFEWLIKKYEIDGATALKLDLSLDTPIILIPRNSVSKDYIQLDLGLLKVTNEISWHGCPDEDPSAVRIDALHAEIQGINMSVGVDGSMDKPMIRGGRGLDVFVRRSLRDVFKRVPTISLEVKVDLLHVVMSDKEYDVILNCITMNLSEAPKLPPSFRGSRSDSQDTMRILADKVNMNSQMLLSRSVTVMAVEINYALLELCNGIHEESPLAHIALEGLWVSYRMTSLSETDLYLTIPKFTVLDIRPATKSELRLMLGSSTDASKHASSTNYPLMLRRASSRVANLEDEVELDAPVSTMFLMDCRWRASSQSFVVRVQQPRVLVVPDFLLAVAEFFVPALGAITGRDETTDPKNDPISKNNCIVLSEPIHRQEEDVVYLSPCRLLVADALGVDDYTYDGCGKTIVLGKEDDTKDSHSERFHPVIIIGCGKRLRFMNVKIENGYILKKYAYLSNDSSYSVSPDDGVDISFRDHSTSDTDKEVLDYAYEPAQTPKASQLMQNVEAARSLTFEAQVVSPEFTFFDGTKSLLDDSCHGEKLLRAKLDLNFMYAAKENDMWVRSLMKDLTVETGSGLVILDPVDISGGYTSVKEKTNISLVSTDVCIHLSLSALSLMLNLQSQAAVALQFGNAIPLAPCMNFDQLWVSPKENGHHNNLTIWRPQAPSNYVILGDCVTSRPIPPSQAVLAVCNSYGRVRKPVGYKLIGRLSDILKLDTMESDSELDEECSLWMPLAPLGYTAIGCVASIGKQPPANHIVYCLRSDLLTSTSYSECMLNVPSNQQFASGFSIWRVDNVLGSFYAHASVEHPSRDGCFDLSHTLLWNSVRSYTSFEEYPSDSSLEKDPTQHTSSPGANSSGWDVIRSISKATNCYMSTPHFERIWWDKGSDVRRPVSIWRPMSRPGYAILGDCITEGLEPPALGIIFKSESAEISAKPVQYTKVAHIMGKGYDEVFFWYPIAPPGYASLGCVVSRTDEVPQMDLICCPRMDLVNQANIVDSPVSRSLSSKASQCWSIWKVENQACTFLARADMKKPSPRLAYTIGDAVKPKTRENLTAEMKLRLFSLTILDSLHGMMTPLFDITVANIKLATHGRFEAMNAVFVSSMAMSAFNTQLEAWEPVVEPFDGIFKIETYNTSDHFQPRTGKRMRIAATNVVNMNVSAANIETFTEAVLSWRRLLELEQKASKLVEEAGGHHGHGEDSMFSALDDDDFQTVIVENQLGCDMFLKKVEQNCDVVDQLCYGDSASVWIPPARFADRLNVADESKEPRCYVAVQIVEAKGLPLANDGNSHNFFCALRLVVGAQATEQQKLFPQSARTKCVKPFFVKPGLTDEGTAKWNEFFIFEVPRKGLAKLEVEVTNLAAKAGKGEVVGSLSFPVGHGANALKKVSSSRMLHQAKDIQKTVSYPLRRKSSSCDDTHECGCLSVSSSYFERSTASNFQRDAEDSDSTDKDLGFWVGLYPDGEWESIRSLLPLSVVPKSFESEYFALEVVMKNGKKHAIFRSLGTLVNESDVNLDITLSSIPTIRDSGTNGDNIIPVGPGSSAVIPWRSVSTTSDQCLLVRPTIGHYQYPYKWGHAVIVVASGTTFATGKDQTFPDQGSLYRENTLKQGNKVLEYALQLNQLEKKDVILCCLPSVGSKYFWLSVGVDASVLHTELNQPVYDWKISFNSPLKLENRLPCPAEFTIWEKTKDGNYIEQQNGVISSRKSAHVYTADVQRPIYLTLFVQGGWILEKDPVVILDLSSGNHVPSFWMVHQQSKRRLRVSIERDMGGTTAAPKTIRLFVPYWIINNSPIPLAYQVVEIDASEVADMDSRSLSRAVKSAKTAFRSPSFAVERKNSIQRRNIQVLEVVEDISPTPSMLSPQDSAGHKGVTLFTSQKDAYVSSRVGISVAVRNSDIYSPGISLLELEKKERIDVKACSSDGSYYKFAVGLNMTSDRTKVIHLQPHTLFVNRTGLSICLQQCDSHSVEWIHPNDPPHSFRWQNFAKLELLKMRIDGYRWSSAFSVSAEGSMRVSLRSDNGGGTLLFRVEVRSGTKSSRYEVIFRPNSSSSPYRIENHSMFLPLRCRQVDGNNDSWQLLLPNTAVSFLWEDLGRQHLLEVVVDGADESSSDIYSIDEISDHQPINMTGPGTALRVTVLKEEKVNVVKITDWMPESEPSVRGSQITTSSVPRISGNELFQQPSSDSECEFHVVVELAELGISLIDHTPEEILYLSVQNLLLAYSTGLGSGFSRLKLTMRGLQVDNQLPLTPMPVLFRLQKIGEANDYILKFSVTQQTVGSLDVSIYPYIGFHGPDNSAFLISIHEPIIWRIHEMIQQINLSRLNDTKTTAVSFDPIVQIGVLNISEVRIKVSMAMSPGQRPRGVLGFWSSLMTALGNTENMPVRINQRFHENVCMRQSTMISNAVSNIKKDLLGQPLQLLSGVDILGNASSALGHMSKGVAALSMDKKFIQSRMRQESKGVEDFGDVIRDGGGALAKGLFRGVTGILTKPLEGAKSSGVEGFVQGVGKGIIGAAAQPVSGVLDFLSKTTEGANAMRMKIASAIASDDQLLRRRLPRVISGDNLLRPYDEYKAQGQVILQLAESISFVDLFKVRGKFALSDAYEDHFVLPKGRILMVTHRRVILMQQGTNFTQRKFNPNRDACSVLWDLLWADLATMELTHGKKDQPKSPPSKLLLYLKTTDMKEQVRTIKCNRDTHQAIAIYSSIERAMNTYSQNPSKELRKKKVTKPYSPMTDSNTVETIVKEGNPTWFPQQLPPRPFGSSATSYKEC